MFFVPEKRYTTNSSRCLARLRYIVAVLCIFPAVLCENQGSAVAELVDVPGKVELFHNGSSIDHRFDTLFPDLPRQLTNQQPYFEPNILVVSLNQTTVDVVIGPVPNAFDPDGHSLTYAMYTDYPAVCSVSCHPTMQ
jgi:hypothetical protein